MTVCGYNLRMGEGIRILFDGMYEAIRMKAQSEGVPFVRILRRELIEIPQINGSIGSSRAPALQLFHGLNEMALAHFERVLADSGSESISKTEFMAGIEEFVSVLEEVENYNLSIPAASSGNKDQIASRANGIGKWIVNSYTIDRSKVA